MILLFVLSETNIFWPLFCSIMSWVSWDISLIFWSLFCSIMSWLSVLGDIFDILVTVLLNYELAECPGRNLWYSGHCFAQLWAGWVSWEISLIFWSLFCSIMSWMSVLKISLIFWSLTVLLHYELADFPEWYLWFSGHCLPWSFHECVMCFFRKKKKGGSDNNKW